MTTLLSRVVVFLAFLPVLAPASDEKPALKEAPARLVKCIESTARADHAAACINVTRDASLKRLRIYALSLGAKSGNVKEGGYDIEIIYNSEMAAESKTAAGAYHLQHNQLVLTFAGAQLAAGEKSLGQALVKLLAAAQPELCWSSPAHSPVPIRRILTGIEKGGDEVRVFLKEATEDWNYKLRLYGP
jgi:hypothetical protein